MHACILQSEQGTGNMTHNKISNIDIACMWLFSAVLRQGMT